MQADSCHSSHTHWSIHNDTDGDGRDDNDHTVSSNIMKEYKRMSHPYFSIWYDGMEDNRQHELEVGLNIIAQTYVCTFFSETTLRAVDGMH